MTLGSLPAIDIIFIIFVLTFISMGFWFGFVHMVGSVVGLLGGALVAGFFYEPVANFIISVLNSDPEITKVIVFFVLLTFITKGLGFILAIVDKIFKITSLIPFVKTFDRLLGSVLGLIEGVIVVGLLIFFSSRFPLGDAFEVAMQSSRLAHPLNFFGEILAPLLPKVLQLIQPIIF